MNMLEIARVIQHRATNLHDNVCDVIMPETDYDKLVGFLECQGFNCSCKLKHKGLIFATIQGHTIEVRITAS